MPGGYHVIQDAPVCARGGDGLGGTQFSAHPAIENTVLLGLRPCRGAASKGPPVRRPRPTPSFRHPIQFAYIRAEAMFISAALIKEKVNSLKEH
jgi:hypothetical protein